LNPMMLRLLRFWRHQAAIYGSAAANGVILITLKGKKNSKGKKLHTILTLVFKTSYFANIKCY
jgi:hypothetical protein